MVIISVNITASTKIAEYHASNNIRELNKTVKNTKKYTIQPAKV
jgi:transcriptional regulator with AAA-type ATPase domain